MIFKKFFKDKKPVIGMVHLKALPGSPCNCEPLNNILEFALRDAEALIEGGVDAVQIENQFDTPYLTSNDIGPETVAFLTSIAVHIRERFPQIPMGINVHLNGAKQALAISKASNANFIRCFNLMNSYISNSGYIGAAAPKLMRYRRNIAAEDIMIFGDFQVKHGSHAITADRSIGEKAKDIQISGAEAAILTGSMTGIAPDKDLIIDIKNNNLSIPLLLGSGINIKNAHLLWPVADGAIIGSGFKKGGKLSDLVDIMRVKEFVSAIR